MKALKWSLWIVGGLVVLLIAAVAIVAATFDPNKYKPEIIDLVKRTTGRTLTMDGKIGLTFFPKIGAEVEKLTLSEPANTQVFARIDEARVALALLPLLSRELIVDQIAFSGLAVDLVRYKDGRTNFDDLTGKAAPAPGAPPEKPAEPAGRPFAIDVGGIVLKNANVGWRDEREGTDVRLSNVNLETGRIASGVPGKIALAAKVEGKQPLLNVAVELGASYRLDFEKQAIALSSFDATAVGDLPGVAGLEAKLKGDMIDFDPTAKRINLAGIDLAAKSKDGFAARFAIPKLQLAPDRAESKEINGEVKLAQAAQKLDAKLQLAALEATGDQIKFSRFDIDLDAKSSDVSVRGKLGTPVALNLATRQVELPDIAGDLTLGGPNIPGKSVKAAVKGGARADWGKQSAGAALAVRIDDSTVQAKVAVVNWSKPAINFDVNADRLNIDRYFPPAKPPAPATPTTTGESGSGGASPEKPIDLSALKTLNASGTVTIGALQVSSIKAENVRLTMKAAGGRLDVNPMSANLYQGALAGSASANGNNQSFAVKQQLSGVSIGPLLRDVAEKDLLEGRGNVAIDVTTSGNTVNALKRGLNGTANMALKDGAIKGVDIAGTIRRARALFGSKSAVESQAKGGEKTDFSELSGSFVIKNGVAHNDDLLAKSPLLRLTGAGDIDVGAGTMDYTVKASVVATSTGQGGKDLAQVAGVTAPVRVSGPLDNLKYTIDVAGLATDAAKDALARELQRRLGGREGAQGADKASPPQGSGQQGGDNVRDILRGILGR